MNDKFWTKLGNQINSARFIMGNLSGDVNLFGQVGMMFLPIDGIGNVDDMNSDALASVSDMASKDMSKEEEERANTVLQNARAVATNGPTGFDTLSQAVEEVAELTTDHDNEPTGETRSEYVQGVAEVTESTTEPFDETARAETQREEGETTGTVDAIIEPESDVQAAKSGEGKPRDIASLLGNGEETTTEDEDSEADETEGEFAGEILMDVADYALKSLLEEDSDDGGRRRSKAQLTMSKKAQLGRGLPISQTPDIFPSHRTNRPRSSSGMWGAGSDYQRSLKSKLDYGTG
jgi:hypothetical protein